MLCQTTGQTYEALRVESLVSGQAGARGFRAVVVESLRAATDLFLLSEMCKLKTTTLHACQACARTFTLRLSPAILMLYKYKCIIIIIISQLKCEVLSLNRHLKFQNDLGINTFDSSWQQDVPLENCFRR